MSESEEGDLGQRAGAVEKKTSPSGATAAATMLLIGVLCKLARIAHIVLIPAHRFKPLDSPESVAFSALALLSQLVFLFGIRRRWNWARRVYLGELAVLVLTAACSFGVALLACVMDSLAPPFYGMTLTKVLLQGVFVSVDFVWSLELTPWLVPGFYDSLAAFVPAAAVVNPIVIGVGTLAWCGLRSRDARAYFSDGSPPSGKTWRKRTRVEIAPAILVMPLLCIYYFGIMTTPASAVRLSQKRVCSNNVRQLGLASLLYASDWGGYSSEMLSPLRTYVGNEERVFLCPGDLKYRQKADVARKAPERVYDLSTYVTTGVFNMHRLEDRSRVILVFERMASHDGEAPGHHVCFADGHTEFLTPHEFLRAYSHTVQMIAQARQDDADERDP